VIGARVRWAGCHPNSRRRIYFANHSSHLDFVVLWSALPAHVRRHTRPVAAADYWQSGRVRRFMAGQFNAVLIERHRVSRCADPIEVMLAAMGDAGSLILFPEGTRALDGSVGRFRGGLYRLARRRPDAELVPVYLGNLDRVLPKGEWLPAPLICSVSFGPPLRLADGETCAAFLERARAAVLSLRE
jgi:1-acyl-sn-glycerol-3-phosphate acyltransferase